MQIVFVTELQYFETGFSIYVWQLSRGILIPKDHSVIAQFIIVFQHTALQLLDVSRGLTSPQLCYKVQEDRSIAFSDDAPSVDTTHGAWWIHRASVLGHRAWVSIQGLLGTPGTTNNASLIAAKVRDHQENKTEEWKDLMIDKV